MSVLPDPVILKTNKDGARIPVATRLPFETSPGPGTDLDSKPLWWDNCSVGGYEAFADEFATILSRQLDS